MLRLLLLSFLGFTLVVKAESGLPETIIFAVQPHDAQKYRDNELGNNMVVKLAKSLNVKIDLYECPWARCMQAIKTGKADIIDDLFIDKSREEYIFFLQPHFEIQTAGFRFYADNTKTPVINKWEDLLNLKIGTLRGYKHFPEFDDADYLNKIDLLDIEAVENLLLKNKLDVFIAPPSFDADSFKNEDIRNKLTEQPYSIVEQLPLYLGISRESAWFEYKETLNEKLSELLEKKSAVQDN